METFIQQILNGLVLGSLYSLIALGYTMVYGILNLINFAHGDVLMVGALTALSVILLLQAQFPDLPGWLLLVAGVAVAIPTCVVTSLIIERVAYRPLRNAPRLAPLITAIGVSIVLQTLAMIVWGRNYMTFPQLLPSDPIHFLGATVTVTKLLVIVLSASIMAALMLLVNRSKLGRAMRATAENPRVAGLMGVNPNYVIALTFAIGAGLAAVAGVMLAATYTVAHFYMGFLPGLKAFTAAVLGGIGNIPGAMVGGLLLGLIEALGAGYIGQLTGGVLGSHYQDVFAFIVLCAVLILRPSGLLGERVADRA
ncbi:branched-chain amino acid ABC transporter permease [Betaproteobacteria bacterium PRO7]|jgi:branched-chain amino acid transport system permease protein|nr:branched-chain amino acid ABC transporter permease [Burkholderiaceae bacterium]MDL1861636.1 branched-chain amino acid ABC transporter permease [Betaproteobacteria bacterium PRO7]GIL05249.1 MAG: branched-chain amino acid ABC transporter permease [Betaproteobacteria bacterium]